MEVKIKNDFYLSKILAFFVILMYTLKIRSVSMLKINKKLFTLTGFVMMIAVFSMLFSSCETDSNSSNEQYASIEAKAPSNQVDILLFNDFHGNVAEDTRPGKGKNAGMAKMIGYVKTAGRENPNTIVVAGGDNYQGTAISNLTYGAPVSAMMRAMNVTVSAVGNHEFDWGVKHMTKWQKDGNFTFLAANIVDKTTKKPVTWAKPYMIIAKGGYKIAFIGLAHPDTVTLTSAEHVSGLEFTDPVMAGQEWVDYLLAGKAREGKPDAIIALTHIDSDQKDDAISGNAVKLAEIKGLHAVLSAHSHRTVSGTVNGMPVLQAYCYGRAVGKLSLTFGENKELVKCEPVVDEIWKTKSDIIEDEKGKAVHEKYEAELKPIMGEVIGTAEGEFTHERSDKGSNTLLGAWAAEVQRQLGKADIAIQNGGGLRRTLAAGNITVGDLYEIMPFDNYLVVFDLSGAEIKKAIDHGINNPNITDGQFAGLRVEYDGRKPFESRITKITLMDGTPLDMNKTYKVVVNSFMFTGGDAYDFSKAMNAAESVSIRDALIDAIKKAKTITPKPVDYIKDISK